MKHVLRILKVVAKLANIAWQTLLFVSESLAMDEKVKPDLRRKQQCVPNDVGQFRDALRMPATGEPLWFVRLSLEPKSYLNTV